MSIPFEVEIIEVHDVRQLPKSFIPFDGTPEKARELIVADQNKEPEKRRFPTGVNTIYHFVSTLKKGWHIVAIDPKPHTSEVDSILVEGEFINVVS